MPPAHAGPPMLRGAIMADILRDIIARNRSGAAMAIALAGPTLAHAGIQTALLSCVIDSSAPNGEGRAS